MALCSVVVMCFCPTTVSQLSGRYFLAETMNCSAIDGKDGAGEASVIHNFRTGVGIEDWGLGTDDWGRLASVLILILFLILFLEFLE